MRKEFTTPRRKPRGPCSVLGCGRGGIIKAASVLVCNKHYQCWTRYGAFSPPTKSRSRDCICSQCGTPFDMGYTFVKARRKNVFCSPSCRLESRAIRSKINEVKRFWSFVDIRAENECWPWKGQLSEAGYGCFSPASRKGSTLATRKSLEFKFGRPVRPGLLACHTCDNPPCVNPNHLYEGTHKDNMADCVARGRTNKRPARIGSAVNTSKLTQKQASIIYNSDDDLKELAERFGVTTSAIRAIKTGKNWKWVNHAA